MKIGFTQLFPYRPHPAHEAYLAQLARQAGHEATVLVCGGSSQPCYNKAIRAKSGLFECLKCKMGGSRAYWSSANTAAFKPRASPAASKVPAQRLVESAGFLYRAETVESQRSEDFRQFAEQFAPVIAATRDSVNRWIDRYRLDALVVFNGRQDMTAGAVMAARDQGIPFLTHERSWFGFGIKLNPGQHCNSLVHVQPLVAQFDNCPLTSRQAEQAFGIIASRFNQTNVLEWRLYNPEPLRTDWPDSSWKSGMRRVLVVPSSRCEFLGSSEYALPWGDNIAGLDLFLQSLSQRNCSVVIRSHPVWAEKIGGRTGDHIEESYCRLAERHQAVLVPAESKQSTYDLIRQADIVVVNGGSSAVEAGFLGKEVVSLSPAAYNSARFVRTMLTAESIADYQPDDSDCRAERCSSTLRYVYTRFARFPQFCRFVVPQKTTEYRFRQGADAERLISLLNSQSVPADDATTADSSDDEAAWIQRALDNDFSLLGSPPSLEADTALLDPLARWPYSMIHRVRPFLKHGDKR